MKPIIMDFDYNSDIPLYIQLYRSVRDDIISGDLKEGEKANG